MRSNLITQFFCSECGRQLNIKYDNDDVPTAIRRGDVSITDAECRYNQIYIEPCCFCIEKHTKPAKKLAEAINQLVKGE